MFGRLGICFLCLSGIVKDENFLAHLSFIHWLSEMGYEMSYEMIDRQKNKEILLSFICRNLDMNLPCFLPVRICLKAQFCINFKDSYVI